MFFKSDSEKTGSSDAPKATQPQMQPPAAPAAAPMSSQPRPTVGSVSTIGEGIKIKGEFKGEGELRVDGIVDGKVDCHTVVVGENGTLKGDVAAKVIVVSGKFDGKADAERVTLTRQADVQGDITVSESIEIETGARFEGNCRKVKAEGAPAAAQPAAKAQPASTPPAAPAGKPAADKPAAGKDTAGKDAAGKDKDDAKKAASA